MNSTLDVTLARDLIPLDVVRPWHRAALRVCGLAAEDIGWGVMLKSDPEIGVGAIDVLPSEVDQLFSKCGLDAFGTEPFVARFRDLVHAGLLVEWAQVVQLVLQDLPRTAIAKLDFCGAFAIDGGRPEEFGGFATRVTREAIFEQPPVHEFFAALDARQRWKDSLEDKPLDERVAAAAHEVAGGEMSLGDALRTAFPECVTGDESAHSAVELHVALHRYIEAWAEGNQPEDADQLGLPYP